MISAALCMYEDGYLHYHLGCSDKEYLNLGTNIFPISSYCTLGKTKGLHTFHLGGGYTGRILYFNSSIGLIKKEQ